MKKTYLAIAISLFLGNAAIAQSSLTHVLTEIEANNKTLKKAKQAAKVSTLDAKTDLYPGDLKVDYERLYGNDAKDNKKENELTISQEIDFPTAYIKRNKLANTKVKQLDTQYAIYRQDILFEARQTCIELVYYNRVKKSLTERLENAKELDKLYEKKMELGDANLLERNKIALELMNVRTEYRQNEILIANSNRKLEELNGGNSLQLSDTSYFEINMPIDSDDVIRKALEENLEYKNLQQEREVSAQSLGLAKSLALPKINMGYKTNWSNPERSNGFVAGLSIPLWKSNNLIRKAKAETILAEMEMDNKRTNQIYELNSLYKKVIELKKSTDEYKQLLATQQGNTLLSKALSLGQISLLQYLAEINYLYQSTENCMQTERDYYLALAELLKYQL